MKLVIYSQVFPRTWYFQGHDMSLIISHISTYREFKNDKTRVSRSFSFNYFSIDLLITITSFHNSEYLSYIIKKVTKYTLLL